MSYPEKNKHKGKKPKEYKTNEPAANIMSEPVYAYGHSLNSAMMRTVGLMGMEKSRDFASVKNEKDFIDVIRAGIPRQAMSHLMEVMDMSLDEMAAIVHTSDRTLRRYTPHQKLSQEQSERMIELARLYSRGEEVFGSIDKFKDWMNTVLLSLGNKKPKDFLDTSIGIGMLMDELGRIEHGIFA